MTQRVVLSAAIAACCLAVGWVGVGAAAAAALTSARVVVPGSGLYKVEATQLAGALGVSADSVRATIKRAGYRMSSGGTTVSYLKAADGRALYFYGRSLDTIYTGRNVYWITPGSGKIMGNVALSSRRRTVTTRFRDTALADDHLMAAPGYFHDPEADFWLWDALQSGAAGYDDKTYDLAVPDVSSGMTLKVSVYGLTTSKVENEHHLRLSLNGAVLGDGEWTGRTAASFSFAVPRGVLHSGVNQARLQAIADPGVNVSVWGLQSFSTTYQRSCLAVKDQLAVSAGSSGPLRVSRLSSRSAWVLDITAPATPRRVSTVTTGGKRGNAWVQFAARSGKRYLVATARRALAPVEIAGASEPGLKVAGRGADYVVITAPSLRTAAEGLAGYRAQSGLRTAVVTTQDIYDDFSYGVTTPHAITDFVAYASANWSPKPRFVVLAGDGSYDYRDYLGYGECLVPSLMTDSSSGVTMSDNRLMTANEAAVPEVAVGRIPVSTPQALAAYVGKLQRYEAASGAWRSRVTLVADKPGDAGDFTADSEQVAALLPPSLSTTKAYQAQLGFAATRSKTLAAVSQGAFFLNYVGHGGLQQLGSDPSSGLGLLQVDDVGPLVPSDQLPVMAMMTCSAGQFDIPGYPGLGEALVADPVAGAIAVFGPTAWEADSESAVLDRALVRALFATRAPVVGSAVQDALAADVPAHGLAVTRRTYALLGDPALVAAW